MGIGFSRLFIKHQTIMSIAKASIRANSFMGSFLSFGVPGGILLKSTGRGGRLRKAYIALASNVPTTPTGKELRAPSMAVIAGDTTPATRVVLAVLSASVLVSSALRATDAADVGTVMVLDIWLGKL